MLGCRRIRYVSRFSNWAQHILVSTITNIAISPSLYFNLLSLALGEMDPDPSYDESIRYLLYHFNEEALLQTIEVYNITVTMSY